MATQETWLRVVIYKSETGNAAEQAEYLKSSTQKTLRMLEKQPGFKLGYWGHNPVADEMSAVTYWDSLDAIKSADSVLTDLHRERREHGIAVASARNIKLIAMPAGGAWQPAAEA
ncbi:MAG: hypothetical protein ACT4QG_03280 [Sporichthyaceae bacterium]